MTQMHEQDREEEEEEEGEGKDKEEQQGIGRAGNCKAGLRAVEMEEGRQRHYERKRVWFFFLASKDSVNNESYQEKVPNRAQWREGGSCFRHFTSFHSFFPPSSLRPVVESWF